MSRERQPGPGRERAPASLREDEAVTFGTPAGDNGRTVHLHGGDGTPGDWRRDYERGTTVAHVWKARPGPGLFWRPFEPVENYRPSRASFVYRRVDDRPASGLAAA